MANLNAEWQKKFQQDREQLFSSIQADIARSNQEVANAKLILLMISAPIDASETLSKNLSASKSQAEANLNAQLANDDLDLTRQKRRAAASDLENSVRQSESIASSVIESSKLNVASILKGDGFKTSLRSIEGTNVRDAAVYVGIANAKVESAPAGENREAAKKLIGQSQEILKSSDEALASGELEKGNAGLDITYSLADAAIALAPLVIVVAAPAALPLLAAATAISFAKDFYETTTGRHLFSGKELTKTERGFAAFGVIAVFPFIKVGRVVGALTMTAADAGRIFTAIKSEAEVAEATAAALKAAQIAVDASVRAGINGAEGAAAFSKAARTLNSAGFDGNVIEAVTTISHWKVTGGTSSLMLGDFFKTSLTGGMHAFPGLKNFFSLNPAAQAAIKVEVASNGVGRVLIPESYLSKKAAAGAEFVTKTLFPESWTAQKIVNAVDYIVSNTLIKEGTFASEMLVDGVTIRVTFKNGSVLTAFPIFPL